MEVVLKCDYCSHFLKAQKEFIDEMKKHEEKCSFNSKNKKCFTCEHKYYDWDLERCNLNLDTLKGQDEGNCKGWKEIHKLS